MSGDPIELDIEGPAAGGSCVARHDGRVVFVRHALPGERVRAVVTDDRDRFLRADAVEILTPSADRVAAPCPYAGPGKCGGCDWQHADGDAQRRIKAEVIRDQFARIGGLDVEGVVVEELPDGLLGWRSRIVYAVDADGRPGLHRYRSREIVPVDSCPLGMAGVGDSDVLRQSWPGRTGVEAARGADDDVTVLEHRPGPGRHARGRRPPDRVEVIEGPARLGFDLLGRRYEVSAGGFWQVHPAAGTAFAEALLAGLAPQPGERVLDLYAGAGAFTGVLATAVGPAGHVLGIESSAVAVEDAERNLADMPWARVDRGRIDADLIGALTEPFDLVVLDPPRAGAGAETLRAVAARGPRAVGYVSCDPATLARDVAAAVELGWELAELRAFDAFPMTHHVECVATLRPAADRGAP